MIYVGLSLRTIPILPVGRQVHLKNEAINKTLIEIHQIASSGDAILAMTLQEND
jgi:hypothetical protein